LVALLAAPVVVAIGLSMPWQTASCGASGLGYFSGSGSPSAPGLPDLAYCSFNPRIDGWFSVGEAAALAGIYLAGLAAWSLFRRGDARGLIGGALALGYFTVGDLVTTLLQARGRASELEHEGVAGVVRTHLGSGAYVGLGGAALALIAGGALARRRGLPMNLSRLDAAAAAFAVGLLIVLLLPWLRTTTPVGLHVAGVSTSPGTLAAALAIWLLVTRRSLVAAGCCALFVAASLDVGSGGERMPAAWIGVACVVLLVAALVSRLRALRGFHLSVLDMTTVVLAITFVVSLFLPWQQVCSGGTGGCTSATAFGHLGSTAALAAIALAAFVPTRSSGFVSRGELAAALALCTATLGFQLQTGSEAGERLGFGFGAFLGFVCAGLLVATTFGRPSGLRASSALAPMLLVFAYLVAVVVPWWGVLPDRVWATFIPWFTGVTWLTVASALVGVRLLRLWTDRSAGGRDRVFQIIALSISLIVLSLLETLPLPSIRPNWNTGVLLCLAVSLTVPALVEAHGGWRTLHVPEILRIDRIS
jgi:hypothetical protein